MGPWVVVVLVLAGALVLLLCGHWFRQFEWRKRLDRARREFASERDRLENGFFTAASASGKPRGLRWKKCDWDGDVQWLRDRHSGQVVALVACTIAFEAVEGSDMEGLAAVGNLREACGVFFYDRGNWHTDGKTLFNVTPDEAVQRFQDRYEPIG